MVNVEKYLSAQVSETVWLIIADSRRQGGLEDSTAHTLQKFTKHYIPLLNKFSICT